MAMDFVAAAEGLSAEERVELAHALALAAVLIWQMSHPSGVSEQLQRWQRQPGAGVSSPSDN